MNALRALTLSLLFIIAADASAQRAPASMEAKIRRFAPMRITADISKLSSGDRQALAPLISAAKLMDEVYMRQQWRIFGDPQEDPRQRLLSDPSPAGKEFAHYFNINMGPWSRLDNDSAFSADFPPHRPPGANYYPEDMTREEFNAALGQTQDEEMKRRMTGFFYTIRRDENGRLYPVPYSEEYKDLLTPIANLLREAAASADNPSLKRYLTKRADAFASNDYYESDVAWMDLDSPIEPVIGPYEVYMDELFNYKAAFEAFVTIRNDSETQKLAKYSSYLQEIEDNLPIEPKYRNPKLGALSPIRVVDEIVVGGEAHAGVQTAAFNLPNDERVIAEKGSKRVLLKNVQEAKFNRILSAIGKIALEKNQQGLVAFEPFFTHILAHELMHGLGPNTITVNGRQSTVRQELKELNSALEEAKADISGLFMLQHLIEKGVIDTSFEKNMYATYLAGTFRSVRFGTNEAHGKGMALQFNYLTDLGAFNYQPQSGTFSVDFKKIKDGVRKLTGEIMTLQAEGNYAGAKALLEKYGVVRPQMQVVLNKLAPLPVDIEPVFPLAR